MAWTTPRTWVTNEVVTAAIMNQYIRDNQVSLKDPPTDLIDVDEASNYTTSSASFVDVDSAGDPDLSLSITTSGGDVMVAFMGTTIHSAADGVIYLDVDIDGARVGGDDGIIFTRSNVAGDRVPMTFVFLVQGLSAGSHTAKLQWKTSAATATLYAGAGTAANDVHPQMWFREVS